MITKQEILKKYRVSKFTFDRLVNRLDDDKKSAISLQPGRRFYNSKQVEIIKQIFGDFNQQCFKTKCEMYTLYGVSHPTFNKMLLEAFGANHRLLIDSFANNFFTAAQVQEIENVIGEP